MNNYISTGKKINIIAEDSISSGEVVIISSLLGVATKDAQIGDTVTIYLDGIFQLPKKTTDTINFGNVVYYDSSAKEITTTKTAYFIGYAVENKTNTDTEIFIKLEPLPGVIVPVRNGWAQYTDTNYTVGSPFTLAQSSSYSAIPNNKGTVLETYLPPGVSTFYDGTKITPEAIGDYYIFTLRFSAKNSSNTGSFDFGIDIGGTQGIIFKETLLFTKGANTEQNFSIDTPGFTLGTFLANGGIIKIAPLVGDVEIYNIFLQVVQLYKS